MKIAMFILLHTQNPIIPKMYFCRYLFGGINNQHIENYYPSISPLYYTASNHLFSVCCSVEISKSGYGWFVQPNVDTPGQIYSG